MILSAMPITESIRRVRLKDKVALIVGGAGETAQDGAEQLVEFTAFDLRDKLQPIGRLEILNAVIAKVQEYYKAFPAQDEAIDVLRRRSAP
jgi:hypothetical protein